MTLIGCMKYIGLKNTTMLDLKSFWNRLFYVCNPFIFQMDLITELMLRDFEEINKKYGQPENNTEV
jgi:hypothetical protein